MNGVAAKFERMPSSLRLERITSPGLAACGRISQTALWLSGTGAHQRAGYWSAVPPCPDANSAGEANKMISRSPSEAGCLAMETKLRIALKGEVKKGQDDVAGESLTAATRKPGPRGPGF